VYASIPAIYAALAVVYSPYDVDVNPTAAILAVFAVANVAVASSFQTLAVAGVYSAAGAAFIRVITKSIEIILYMFKC